jgi:anti-anti-sigma factor
MIIQSAGARISTFEINLEYHDDTGTMLLSGELDSSGEHELEQQYRSLTEGPRVRKLILDVRRLAFSDRRALDLIRSLCERAHGDGLDLILMRAPSELRKELERAGLHQLLPIAYELSDSR